MQIKSITSRCFRPYKRKARNDLDSGTEFVKRDEEFRKNYYAFTCLLYHARPGKLFCGTTNFSNDILHSFDPVSKKFESLGYAEFTKDKYEIKCHRSLAIGKDGKIYGATSCLHHVNERLQAPGGKIFRYDTQTQKFETLCIPKPHDYIQTISLDPLREMIYGFTYPVFEFFAYSIPENKVRYIQYMGSIPHLSAIDDEGGYWGTWGDEHRFFRYDPDENRVRFFEHGLPNKCQSLMYKNAGPLDMVLNIEDGGLYICSETAELFRLNPSNAQLNYCGKAFPSVRMPGLCLGPRGLLFAAGGVDGGVRVCSYDRKLCTFKDLGPVVDSQTKEKCFRAHDLAAIGHTLYLGETDNPARGDYLWEIELDV
jgi:hypothetical protein